MTRDFSSLVDRRGWRGKFAPLRSAFDELGPLRPAIREPMAGDWDIPVFCGIHDSNASLLPHLMTRQAPFTVVSTGTWAVLFAVGAEPTALDKDRDTLANVDAFGRPVPSARFMAGREFTEMAGAEPGEASREAAERVIARQAMALPSFAKGTGPFPTRTGDWTLDPATLDQGERTAAASLSAALTTETCLSLIGACGPIIVAFCEKHRLLRRAGGADGSARRGKARPDRDGRRRGLARPRQSRGSVDNAHRNEGAAATRPLAGPPGLCRDLAAACDGRKSCGSRRDGGRRTVMRELRYCLRTSSDRPGER